MQKREHEMPKHLNSLASSLILEEKMDIGNFLHDSMDLNCIRQLIMKSRHKILIPLLMLHITKSKTIKKKGYKGAFYRNMHERNDQPVFTINDAIEQLKNSKSEDEIIRSMDNFL